eukprot:m.328164 g.328164  ORF g.328164 m.328164 type:complete len:58 (-) comp16031_c1_seq3:653-826(-)
MPILLLSPFPQRVSCINQPKLKHNPICRLHDAAQYTSYSCSLTLHRIVMYYPLEYVF